VFTGLRRLTERSCSIRRAPGEREVKRVFAAWGAFVYRARWAVLAAVLGGL